MLAERGRLSRALEVAEQGLSQAEAEFSSRSKDEWEPLRNLVEINACLGELLMARESYAEAAPYLKAAVYMPIPDEFSLDLFDTLREHADDLLIKCSRHIRPRLS
ncbi:hypothetical protein J2X66_006015 [Pseudomonas sp. 3296]|nr:hypothetical protein [Pseudomonas sp. 3296]